MATHPAHAQLAGDDSDTSSLDSADQFNDDEEYAKLAGLFDVYGGLLYLDADRVEQWAGAFEEKLRCLITQESPGMVPFGQELFIDSSNFLFKDIFGLRAMERIKYIRNSEATPDIYPRALDLGHNVPPAMQLFANHYSAWCKAQKSNRVHYQVLQFKAANQMYEDYQVLCSDSSGAIKTFLSSCSLTPTSGRRHCDLVTEYLVKELGIKVSPYQFQQTIRDMECINCLVRSFGHGVLALLPQETIGCLQVWNPHPNRIILLLEDSFIAEARRLCQSVELYIAHPGLVR